MNPTSVTNCGIVLSQPIPNTNDGSTIYDILFTLYTGAPSQQTGGYILPLQPALFNFNLAYVVVRGVTATTVTFQIEPTDALFPTASSSTMTVTLPTGFTPTSNILTLNGVANTLSGAGYSAQIINYQQSNSYQLILTAASSVSGAHTFTFAGSDTNGSTTKMVTITI